MKTDLYVLLFSIIFFGITGIWYLSQMIKYWKFCYSKNNKSLLNFKKLKEDQDVIAKNKNMIKSFFFIAFLFFIFFVLLIVSTGYLKKIGYLI